MNAIGIMQGRLSAAATRPQSFPSATWRDEFDRARQCGFDRLEWLVTADEVSANPVWDRADQIRELTAASGVDVTSLCADCFIPRPVVRVSRADRAAGIALLSRLITRASQLGITLIVLPLLESNAIANDAEGLALLTDLQESLAQANEAGVRIALESDLPVDRLIDMVDASAAALGVCYDVGNAAAAGKSAPDEIVRLAHRVRHVHVKDRRRLGPGVPLGQGDASLAASVDALRAVAYTGALILETPAGTDPIASAAANLAFLRRLQTAAAAAQPS